MNKYLKIGSLFCLSLLTYSCAVEREESAEDIERRVLNAYIKVVHKDTISPTTSGLYIITKERGRSSG